MSDLTFHRCLLYKNENLVSKTDCDKIDSYSKGLEKHIFKYRNMPHEIYTTLDEANHCLWIYLKSGSSLPYDDTVIDVETNEKTANPRQITQVELRHQYFTLYDYDKSALYLSTLKTIGILENFFKKAIGDEDITIKKILKDFNDVLKTLKSIKSIRLVAKNGLFTQTNNLFQDVADAFGLGIPGQYKIDVDFGYASLTEHAIGKLREINQKRLGGEIDSFVCIGRDDTGLDGVFNMDTFTNSLKVKADHDEKGMYQDLEVKQKLIEQLGIINV
ncbi:MAG: hypothetical protein J6Y30_13350 [Treponema sp.]|nr:hypothetical protein [Treponema sp.]